MCGIVGYIGPRPAANLLLEGLRRLEYRGYDSAGTAMFEPDQSIYTTRSVGRIDELARKMETRKHRSTIGIGHTRWATHGPATEENAHPHMGGDGVVCLAHNGVIENYQEIKANLERAGFEFKSATDSEVIAHLLAECLQQQQSRQSTDDPHGHLLAAVK